MVIPFLSRTRPQSPQADSRTRQEAFYGLVRPHLQALYRLAYRFTGSQHEAEDLIQELLTRLYSRAERLDAIQSLRPWLARALYNLYVDERRRFGRSPLGHLKPVAGALGEDNGLATCPDHNADPGFHTEMAMLHEQLGLLLQRLPAEQREVVILHDVEGYQLHEAAEILGVAVGTVKSRLHRGHERLREWLRQRNLSPSNVVISDEASPLESQSSGAQVSSDEM